MAAEQLLVGALLIDPDEVAPMVRVCDLIDPRIAAIADAAVAMYARSEDPTPIAIASALAGRGVDTNYIVDLIEEARVLGGKAAAAGAAAVVREHAERRRLIGVAQRMQLAAEDGADAEQLRGILAAVGEARDDTDDDTQDWRAVADEPPIEWIVDGVVPRGGLVVLAGDPKAGKSLLALDLALRLQHGMPWFGRATRASSSVYVSGEGAGGIPGRLRAWGVTHQAERPLAPHYVVVRRRMPILTSPAGVAELRRVLARLRRQQGRAPDVLVIDTFARAAAGSDENDAAAVGAIIAALEAIRREFGCAIVIVHHTRKATGERRSPRRTMHDVRGSSALAGAVDVVLIADASDDGVRTMQAAALRDGEEWAPITYAITGRDTGRTRDDGRPEYAPVVLPAGPALVDDANAEAIRLRAAADDRRRAVVAAVEQMGGHVPTRRSIVDRVPGRDGSLYAAIREALAAGDLLPDGDGLRLPSLPDAAARAAAPLRGAGSSGSGQQAASHAAPAATGSNGQQTPTTACRSGRDEGPHGAPLESWQPRVRQRPWLRRTTQPRGPRGWVRSHERRRDRGGRACTSRGSTRRSREAARVRESCD